MQGLTSLKTVSPNGTLVTDFGLFIDIIYRKDVFVWITYNEGRAWKSKVANGTMVRVFTCNTKLFKEKPQIQLYTFGERLSSKSSRGHISGDTKTLLNVSVKCVETTQNCIIVCGFPRRRLIVYMLVLVKINHVVIQTRHLNMLATYSARNNETIT